MNTGTLLNRVGRAGGIAALAVVFGSLGFGNVVYSYGLPTGSTVNASSGRVNYDVAGFGSTNGDTFSLNGASTVRSISIFAVANDITDTTAAAFAAEFGGIGNIALDFGDPTQYTGLPGNCGTNDDCAFSQIATAALITPVAYTGASGGCSGYLSPNTSECLPVFEISFNVNLSLAAGVQYGFSADAPYSGNNTCDQLCGWYNLGSTASDGVHGTQQTSDYQGSNPGTFLNWDTTGLYGGLSGGSVVCPSDLCTTPIGFNMNVILSDTPATVPEPTALSLMLLMVGGLAFATMRRRKAQVESQS